MKKFQIKMKKTGRGFLVGSFKDRYGEECSIQESSLANEPAIWLGVDDVHPQVMVPGQGWTKIPLPDGEVLKSGRMHITQAMAAELIRLLQEFVKTGSLGR